MVAINQFFAPSNFVITVDKSAKGVLKQSWNGAKVELDMPERLILIANHQVRNTISNIQGGHLN